MILNMKRKVRERKITINNDSSWKIPNKTLVKLYPKYSKKNKTKLRISEV